MNSSRVLPLLIILLLLIMGCSGGSGDGDPVLPGDIAKSATGKSHLGLLGFYTVQVDWASGTLKAVPNRGTQDVLNVLGFLEPPPLSNLTIDFKTLEMDPAAGYVGVDVILTHPFDNNYFMGFEVRGVVFGPDITNADGSTRWLNPVEFKQLPWGYKDGLLGAPNSYAHYTGLYNDYKLFTDSYPNPLRGWDEMGENVTQYSYDPLATFFEGGSSKTANYQLDFGDNPDDFMIFNYAIIANYAFPTGTAPWGPEDFPIEAHCPEPFYVSVEMYDNDSYWDPPYGAGGVIELGVRVCDWSNPGMNDVTIAAPGLFNGEISPTYFLPEGPISGVFVFDLTVTKGSGVGYYPMVITVTDPQTYGGAYFMDGMPSSHALYGEPISFTIDTQAYLNDVDIFFDPYQVGYLTYDDVSGDGEGYAAIIVRIDWPGIGINSVDLDTGPFGFGILTDMEPKGDSGYIFNLTNNAALVPGEYPLNITVHFSNLFDHVAQVVAEVIAKAAKPPPFWSHPIAYGGTNIGTIQVTNFAEATCGVNMQKSFIPNGNELNPKCDEYRWIQVITTDAPMNGGSNTGYVDPHPNDDDKPFYWTDGEADGISPPPGTCNPTFSDGPRRPAANIPPNPDPTWWHAELILVCVRWGAPDTLLHSEHYFFFKHADGSVDSGHYDGEDGGSASARGTIAGEFPGYDFN